jgi:hypothetical protein
LVLQSIFDAFDHMMKYLHPTMKYLYHIML